MAKTLTQWITFGAEQSFGLSTYYDGALTDNTITVDYTLSVSKCKATLSLTFNKCHSYLSGATIELTCDYYVGTKTFTVTLSSSSTTTKTVSWGFNPSYTYIKFGNCTYTKNTAMIVADKMVYVTTSATDTTYYDDILARWSYSNTAPTATINVPELTNGIVSRISWTTSDADGDTVYAKKLVRYTKVVGATDYTSETLFSNSSTSNTYYNDTIPYDAGGGSVYYVLTVTDDYDETTVESSIVTVTSVEINSIAIHPTGYIDGDYAYSSAENLEKIFVSGGRLGLQLELAPEDLLKACSGKFADIVQ